MRVIIMKNDRKAKKELLEEPKRRHQSVELNENERLSDLDIFYSLATENSSEGVVIVSGDRLLFFNRKYLELCGYKTAEELKGKPFLSSVHPDNRERVKEIIRRRQAGEPAPSLYECKLRRSDGSTIHIEISASLITHRGQPASLGYIRDISDRKQADYRLSKAQREWENIFQAIGQPTFIINPQYIILAANSALVDVSGISMKDILGKKCYEIFHGRDSKDHPDQCPLAKLILTGKMETAEMEVDAFGGTSLISCIPVFDDEGRLEQIIHISTDITQKKRMEETLRKSESTLKSIFLAAPIGIGLTSDRIILQVNDRLCEMLGYSRAELIGKSARIFYPTDEEFEFVGQEKYAQIARLGTGTVETSWICKKGEIIRIILSSTALDPSNLANGVTFTALDITERGRTEEALRESERKYRFLADNSFDVIWTLSLDGRFTYVSPSIRELSGFAQEEVIGIPLVKYFVAEDAVSVMETLYQELQKPREERSERRIVEARQYKKDGSLLDIEVSTSLLYDSQGDVIGLQGSTRDISARKKMEESRSRLEVQISQVQKMEAIGTLAGGIAHDFNNILMGIQGYISLTKLDLKADHPHYERLQKIEEQIISGAHLTRQLLGFARGGKYEVKPTDLNYLLKTSSDIFGRTKKEILISYKFQKDLWVVDADQGQVEQVLLNLYINAWQAMPGGGDLYLESQNVILNVADVKPHGVRPGRYVKISVMDTGTGIDAQTRERIFEPFFTTRRPDKGTGLGLASAYGIIKNHGGFITVNSEPGRGSTFNIYLPASDKAKITEENFSEQEQLLRGKETILLVDDEQVSVTPTKELLESLGYRVIAAGSGQEAIAIYMEKGKSIDLIILDMIMPGISGGKVFDTLLEIDPAVKVILSTGYSLNGEAQHIMNRGCKGFIQKPFRILDLTRKIREIL
jgi:PAS domain S-box-containing protein